MRPYTLAELFYLTRRELFELHARTAAELAAHRPSSPEHGDLMTLLRNIRRVLARAAP